MTSFNMEYQSRIGTYNLRKFFGISKLAQLFKSLSDYRLLLLGIFEVGWSDAGKRSEKWDRSRITHLQGFPWCSLWMESSHWSNKINLPVNFFDQCSVPKFPNFFFINFPVSWNSRESINQDMTNSEFLN